LSLSARRRLFAVLPLATLIGCATSAPAPRHFRPASAADSGEALKAWAAATERASRLPASRLLYDAKLSTSGTPSVAGTLAVRYDGSAVVDASLTGPFGSRIAEYREGAVTGEDRKALVVDPEALRAVLAGVWSGPEPNVEGRDAGESLLSWNGSEPGRIAAVLDLSSATVVSMELSRGTESLSVSYSGTRDPWPERIAMHASSGRALALKLVAVEKIESGPASSLP